ncbi:signal transduction histidine kinase [Rhodoligotrophos appendicifer]|uniref:sensor histidine kinase n=1 Tax=Rhodoligotrophos appendicifer TaxID=987056 RepID=UPI001479344A|nr:PAS-domain containing protein [Rhodoligotrophos appendicifer]
MASSRWLLPTVQLVGSVLVLSALPARAELSLPSTVRVVGDTELIWLGVAVLVFAIFLWALLATWRLERKLGKERRRRAELEAQLNDAEAALSAEPHLLFIWRGGSEAVERIVGDMRETCTCPLDRQAQADFESWLELESVATLGEALRDLKSRGTAFNIGVKTLAGELLEADGRAAGGLATLRLRPLAGERREITKLAHESRKLARQVERLTAILDNAPLPIWLRDEEHRLTWANQAYVQAVDAETISTVLAAGIELVNPERKLNARLAANGRSQGAVDRRRSHTVINGTKRALDVVEVAVTDGEAGFALDVTALEDVERELKRHIRAHASTLDKLTTAIAIFGQDQRLRFSNSAFAKLWRLDTEWLATNPSDGEILDRLREERSLPEQANYRDWRARHLDVYKSIDTREDWWHLPDGRTLRVIAEQHPFGGVTYLYENITEQIRLESQYNQLIDVQRETLDNLHEALALFGTDGRLKLFNPAYSALWGLDTDFLASEPHIDAVFSVCRQRLPDDLMWDELKYAVTSVDDDRRPLQGRIERPDGNIFDFSLVPLPDGNTLLTYTDVTDSSRIERALRERTDALEAADRLKTDFLQNVSYELRTPLTNIIGFADSLCLGLAGELLPKQREYTNDILVSSADLLSIIDAILDLTTIDAGAMELRFEEVEITELMTDAAQMLRSRIEKRGITLQVEIPEAAGTFIADKKRLKQILFNLLSNAIGFSLDHSTIRMGARREGDDVVMWVSDLGKGMDPEFQKAAFERFKSRPGISGHRGPGLGLSLVKSFVELHDGTVSLRSRLDKGTTVICRLPSRGPRSYLHRNSLAERLPKVRAL